MSQNKYKIPSPQGFPRIETSKKPRPLFPRVETNPKTIEVDSEWIIDEEDVDESSEEN